MYDIKEFIVFVGVLGALILSVIGICSGVNYLTAHSGCDSFGKISGTQTYYSIGTGCIVKYNGEWVDYGVATKAKQEISIKAQQHN